LIDRKTVCIITGTRAEYGLLRPLIDKILVDDIFDLRLVATGSHLSTAFGETYHEIENDGYTIHAKIKMALDSDTHAGMARATGSVIVAFTDYFETHRPDMLIVLGDRFELLAAAIAASILCIPIAHIAGGDTSEGAIDEFIRHSITKMSYLHFPTNEQSLRRIIQLGETPERVFNVGALNIDNIVSRPLLSIDELSMNLGFDLDGEYALITYHPVTMREDSAVADFTELLNSIDCFPNMKYLFTKANADSGGRAINAILDKFVVSRQNCMAHASLGNLRYLSAMKHAFFVIGNSSSGLYETPIFGIPCINIGDRQRGRLRAENVIDCPPEKKAIEAAINQARGGKFRAIAKKVVNPFGDGNSAEKISEKINHYLQTDNIDLTKSFYVPSVFLAFQANSRGIT